MRTSRIASGLKFEPLETGTQVSIEFALENQGLPPGLLAPVSWAIAGKVKEALNSDLRDMKKAVEV